MWVSGNLFHVGWNGNYELWINNPVVEIPIAHSIWDPHISTGSNAVVLYYSGLYNWMYAVGFIHVYQLYYFVILTELLAVISITLGKIHFVSTEKLFHWLICQDLSYGSIAYYFDSSVTHFRRLNFHIIGSLSILWAGHFQLNSLSTTSITFLGGFQSNTVSLYITDIAHHHLGVGVLFVWSAHLYSSFSSKPSKPQVPSLSLALAGCCIITSVVGQQIYSLTPYLYLS